MSRTPETFHAPFVGLRRQNHSPLSLLRQHGRRTRKDTPISNKVNCLDFTLLIRPSEQHLQRSRLGLIAGIEEDPNFVISTDHNFRLLQNLLRTADNNRL